MFFLAPLFITVAGAGSVVFATEKGVEIGQTVKNLLKD